MSEHISEEDNKIKAKRNRQIFDVIAGSSIGAVNAAIITGIIKKKIDDDKYGYSNSKKYIKENNNNKNISSNVNAISTAVSQQKYISIWKDAVNNLEKF
jgi:predicted acylesterase/phospholipase RssA